MLPYIKISLIFRRKGDEMAYFQLNNIQVVYDSFQLNIPQLHINKEEFFVLLGESGCGKTTLLKTSAGLTHEASGDIMLNQKNITKISAEKRNISMVFQDALLFPHMSAGENIAFPLKMRGHSKKAYKESVKKILKAIELPGIENRAPYELSGGQQQRVALARAIVFQPDLMIMDEPLSSLDPELREKMRDLILKIHNEYGLTTLFVTHDYQEAFYLADRIGIMRNGQIIQVDTPKRLYENPKNEYVAKLLYGKNIYKGEIKNGKFYSDNMIIEMDNIYQYSKSINIVIPPESLRVIKKKEAESSMILSGEVIEVKYLQGFLSITICHNDKLIHAYHVENEPIRVGDDVIMTYYPKKIRVIGGKENE